MYQSFQVKPCFVYDESGLYCNNSMWIIPTNNKILVGLLNSKMGWWLITKYCTQIQNGCQLIWKYFGQIPILELSNPQLLVNTETMLNCHYYILLETKSDDWWFTFTNDIATEQLENFDPRWWSFCAIFTTDNWDKEYKQLNMYRLAQRNRFNLIACYQVYHYSDQGTTGEMLNTANTWHEIEKTISNKFNGNVLNISAFMQTKTPRKSDDLPMIFFDDFNDL